MDAGQFLEESDPPPNGLKHSVASSLLLVVRLSSSALSGESTRRGLRRERGVDEVLWAKYWSRARQLELRARRL